MKITIEVDNSQTARRIVKDLRDSIQEIEIRINPGKRNKGLGNTIPSIPKPIKKTPLDL